MSDEEPELIDDPEAWLAARRRRVWARVMELLFDDEEEDGDG